VARPQALQEPVTLTFGTVPAPLAAVIHLTEVLVHGSDIAVAIGAQHLIGEELCAELLTTMHRIDNFRVPGIFGPAVPVDQQLPTHLQLITYLGRTVMPTSSLVDTTPDRFPGISCRSQRPPGPARRLRQHPDGMAPGRWVVFDDLGDGQVQLTRVHRPFREHARTCRRRETLSVAGHPAKPLQVKGIILRPGPRPLDLGHCFNGPTLGHTPGVPRNPLIMFSASTAETPPTKHVHAPRGPPQHNRGRDIQRGMRFW
jgi:hypothetical protein